MATLPCRPRKFADLEQERQPKIILLGNIAPDTPTFADRDYGRVYHPNGLSPTIRAEGHPTLILTKIPI